MTDPQVLHTQLLDVVKRQDPYGLLTGWGAVKAVLELHKPRWVKIGEVESWQCVRCGCNIDNCLEHQVIATALGVVVDG